MLKKISVNSSSGQATVEYILLLVLVASLVGGLMSFSGPIEAKFKSAKITVRDKLSGGGYKLQRTDFGTKAISTTYTDGKGGEEGTTDAGSKGAAKGAGADKKATSADAASATAGKLGKKTGKDTTEEASDYSLKRTAFEQEEIDRANKAAQEYQAMQMSTEDAIKAKEKEMISERRLALASAEEKENLLRKAKADGIISDKEKAFEQRNWNIGKFIIIVMVVLFIIVILLKSRQGRD